MDTKAILHSFLCIFISFSLHGSFGGAPSSTDLDQIVFSSRGLGSSRNGSPVPYIVVNTEGNSPVDNIQTFQFDLMDKACSFYTKSDIASLSDKQQEEIYSIVTTLAPHLKILDEKIFSQLSYNDFILLRDNLEKYDFRAKFFKGSVIVHSDYEDILEQEYQDFSGIRNKGLYSFRHGSCSRFEQRQQYLADREAYLRRLLQEQYWVV